MPIIAITVSASGTAELGEPVGREAGGLRLGGVVDDLGERRPDGDEA